MTTALTVVIPVWDKHTALLPRCLAAIASERVTFKIVVVDNASQVAVDAPTEATRITLPERRTIAAARNTGLEHVQTPYVLFADADDEVALGSLERSLVLLQHEPRAHGVIGRSTVDEYGVLRRGRTPSQPFLLASRFVPHLAQLFWLIAFQASITSTVLRTSAVRDAGGFPDANLGEDWLLAARLARRGHFICLDDSVRIYHRHDDATRVTMEREEARVAQRPIVLRDCLVDPDATRIAGTVAHALLRLSGG